MNSPVAFWQSSYYDFTNQSPSMPQNKSNEKTLINKRYLYTKLSSVFKFDLPKSSLSPVQLAWPKNFFRFFLFNCGTIGYIYTKKYGWVCLPYSCEKLGFYYNPHKMIFVHPEFKKELVGIRGINAGYIHCMDDFFGLDDVITMYAERLANIDKSIAINLNNSNVALTYPAENKKQAQTLREAYKQATTGEPFIPLYEKDILEKQLMPLIPGVKNNFIVLDLMESRRMIVNEFLTEIGINNANTWKRERVTNQEVNQNNQETESVVTVILENLKEDFSDFKTLTGIDVSVSLRYNMVNGGDNIDYAMGDDAI